MGRPSFRRVVLGDHGTERRKRLPTMGTAPKMQEQKLKKNKISWTPKECVPTLRPPSWQKQSGTARQTRQIVHHTIQYRKQGAQHRRHLPNTETRQGWFPGPRRGRGRTPAPCCWWQKGSAPCAGCSPSQLRVRTSGKSPAASPTTTVRDNPTPAVLQERWSQAKASSQNTKHVKIERFCTTCLLRTMGSRQTCRGCNGDMSDCMKILPGQWPPLNCRSGLLRRYEAPLTPVDKATPVNRTARSPPPHPMDISSATDRPLHHLSLTQLTLS